MQIVHIFCMCQNIFPGPHRSIEPLASGIATLLLMVTFSYSVTFRASCGNAGLDSQWVIHRLRISYLEHTAKVTWYDLPRFGLNPNQNIYMGWYINFNVPGIPQVVIYASVNDLALTFSPKASKLSVTIGKLVPTPLSTPRVDRDVITAAPFYIRLPSK